MGLDLWIAMGVIAAISGLAFVAGRRLSLTVYRHRPLLLGVCLVLALVFAFGLSNRLTWANAFPTSAAMCWANWMPVFLAVTAGLASRMKALRPITRTLSTHAMAWLAVAFLLLPVIRPTLFPVQIAPIATWDDGICLQSHEASCGPAAAATLLHQTAVRYPCTLKFLNGSLASAPAESAEWMMAWACLTSNKGTSSLGLVRGLRMAVSGSDRIVRLADPEPATWVAQNALPNVAVVRFRRPTHRTSVTRLFGGGGEGHAVVVHSRTSDGRWRIADPAVGWRYWSDEEFRQIFTGEAIYLADSAP